MFIIGQFNGIDSITAVSVGSQVMHMLTVMIVGLAMGANSNDWTEYWSETERKSGCCHWKYNYFIYDTFGFDYGFVIDICKTDCVDYVYSNRGSF